MTTTILVLLLTTFLSASSRELLSQNEIEYFLANNSAFNSDSGLNIFQFLEKYNYTYENHTIVTEDGYILRTIRIPNGSDITSNSTNPAVLILHGILSGPFDLILRGPGNSVGLVLADNGYDVWLMCSRGSRYSTNHVSLGTESYEFWDFSWHEVGIYDIPANIDYIIETTGNKNVSFVGHSQGTTAYAVLASARPEYNSKITVSVLLAPVVLTGNTPLYDPIKEFEPTLRISRSDLRWTSILTFSKINEVTIDFLCNEESPFLEECIIFFGLVFGIDDENFPRDLFPVIASEYPGGASIKEALHFLQVARDDKFQYYDYGAIENKLRYGSTTPPEYNLSLATAPVVVMYGANDNLVSVTDALRFINALPNAVGHLVPYPKQNHVDFIYAISIYNYTSQPVLEYLNNYNNIE